MLAIDSIYCPYTDRVLSIVDANDEHIIPLALGGANAFVIPVSSKFNSEVGSSIDGAMTKDFLVAIDRAKYDARGHSGHKPSAKIRWAKVGDDRRPAQVEMSVRDGLRIWDAKARRELSAVEASGITIECETLIDVDLRLKFVAKVALSAGYAIYRDRFKDHVQHRELRAVMNQKKGESSDGYRNFTIRADDALLTPDPDPGSQLEIVRGLCNSFQGSIVMLMPTAGSLTIAVGVLGRYVGMLNVAADTKSFPNSGDYAWGHVVLLTKKRMRRCSVAALLKKVASLATPQESEKEVVPSSDEGKGSDESDQS